MVAIVNTYLTVFFFARIGRRTLGKGENRRDEVRTLANCVSVWVFFVEIGFAIV